MKNTIITIAIVLGLGMTAFAQDSYYGNEASGRAGLLGHSSGYYDRDGGLFSNFNDAVEYFEYAEQQDRNNNYSEWNYYQGENGLFGLGKGGIYMNRGGMPSLPGGFGFNDDQDTTSPLGSGIALLAGLGAAYLVAKRRKEE